jgi:Tfp pilus assembly protein PilO
MRRKRISKSDPKGKLIWSGWSVAMLLLLCFSIDSIMGFNIMLFEVFVGIVLLFVVVLQLLILGWVLYIRSRAEENDERLTKAIRKLETHLEDVKVTSE